MMSPDMIKQIRHKLKLTQQEFAQRLGVTRTTVSRWELMSGRYQPAPTALQLMRLLTKRR